jgi:hypothetical protein
MKPNNLALYFAAAVAFAAIGSLVALFFQPPNQVPAWQPLFGYVFPALVLAFFLVARPALGVARFRQFLWSAGLLSSLLILIGYLPAVTGGALLLSLAILYNTRGQPAA